MAPARSLVAVSAGLQVPSSTRLLADRLVAATERHLRDAGIEPVTTVIELRDHAQDLSNNLLTGFPSPTPTTYDGTFRFYGYGVEFDPAGMR